ncbi:hypothetical protein AQUCO_00600235v1 [Aquilegia coerulea]|uniref:Protein FAR1-RELATED SEQUENCE n=1 Tax=Aquilegia coerulea TaxID=218851 RepID=A0A2G5ENU4_AQUCA|nr:hypothetical protein AQUCO_00600235v1 [Aquilegia coerulea]
MEGTSFDTNPRIEGGRNDNGIESDCANIESSGEYSINQGKKDHLPPAVGMEFDSYDDAYRFYNDYAEDMGFRVRVKSSWSRKLSKEKYHATLCCSCEGFKKQKDTHRSRPETRTGCSAVVRIRRTEFQRWKVTDVVLEHNHIRIRKSNKNFSIGTKRKTPLDSDVATETTSFLNTGSYENLTFAGTDVMNFVNHYKRLKVKGGNAQALHDYFCGMQLTSPNFFYLMDFNDDGHLGNVFWADGRSRAAYGQFCDVVIFDTTYLSHKYEVPLLIFVGVNHHGHSVLLGCGMLADETKESFHWLFKAWLTCMLGRPPSLIITDQVKGLQSAVVEVFPRACHRLCSWNIMQEISEKLKQVHKYKSVVDELNKVVYNSLRVDEFESAWENVIQQHELKHHEWFQTLFEDRRHWVPVFLKEISFLGMLTTSLSESRKPFFEGHIHKHTSMKDFLCQYELALQHKYEEEAKAAFESRNSDVVLKTKCCFEHQLSKVYTREIFLKFQNEVEEMYCCFNTTQTQVDGTVVTYIVKERIGGEGNNKAIREYEVSYDSTNGYLRCICGWFYFKGYLCRHALSVLNHNGVEEIPSQYILSRWRKDVKRIFVSDHGSIYVNANNPLHRYDHLCRRVSQIVEGVISQEHYEVAIQALEDSLKKVRLVEHSFPENGKF